MRHVFKVKFLVLFFGHLDDNLYIENVTRVFGEKVAELPLVGTSVEYRRSGMGHILMNELEKVQSFTH